MIHIGIVEINDTYRNSIIDLFCFDKSEYKLLTCLSLRWHAVVVACGCGVMRLPPHAVVACACHCVLWRHEAVTAGCGGILLSLRVVVACGCHYGLWWHTAATATLVARCSHCVLCWHAAVTACCAGTRLSLRVVLARGCDCVLRWLAMNFVTSPFHHVGTQGAFYSQFKMGRNESGKI